MGAASGESEQSRLLGAESHYAREALEFVAQALQHGVKLYRSGVSGPDRHLTAAELLASTVDLAARRYGILADLVLRQWGIRHNEDIGAITFALIALGLFTKRPEDRIEDFAGHEPLPIALRSAVRRRLQHASAARDDKHE
ncbi:MAG: hypothetical protein N3B15_03630 [Planctomycetota bacterium]|nr:hypothetical protein [Planctomycetota bacterium]